MSYSIQPLKEIVPTMELPAALLVNRKIPKPVGIENPRHYCAVIAFFALVGAFPGVNVFVANVTGFSKSQKASRSVQIADNLALLALGFPVNGAVCLKFAVGVFSPDLVLADRKL
jgi:hypothetical protein